MASSQTVASVPRGADGAISTTVDAMMSARGRVNEKLGEVKASAKESAAESLKTGAKESHYVESTNYNMIGTAIQFGLALMITVLMMLVVGLFIVNVPTSGAYEGEIQTAETIGGAGFVILVVTLLVVPVGGLVMYFARSGLGGFLGAARR